MIIVVSVVCCKRKGGRDRNVVGRDNDGGNYQGRANNIVIGSERNWFISLFFVLLYLVDIFI